MTIGEKIREARLARGIQQTELSQKLGLGKSGERISQYEKGKRTPKAALLQEIAEALDIHVDAISDTSFETVNKTMHAFFELEKYHDLYVHKEADGYSIKIRDDIVNYSSLMIALDQWCVEKEKHPSPDEYLLWTLRYPLDIQQTEEIRKNKVQRTFEGRMDEQNGEARNVETVEDLARIIISVIDSDIGVLFSMASYPGSKLFGVISFNTNDLLNRKDTSAYVDFVAGVEQMTRIYEMEIETGTHTYNDIIYLDYYFKNTEIKTFIHSLVRLASDIESGKVQGEFKGLVHEKDLDDYRIFFESLKKQGRINN